MTASAGRTRHTDQGCAGLSDRVAALDGRLELTSADGNGTTVKATIPCG